MDCDDYQQQASKFAIYPVWAKTLYPTLGLVGEVGELVAKLHAALWPYGQPVPDGEEPFQDALLAMIAVGQRCETLKKQVRGDTTSMTVEQKRAMSERIDQLASSSEHAEGLTNEVGDCEWYVANLLIDLHFYLSDVLQENLLKLSARKQKGQIHLHTPDSQDHKE